MIKLIYGFRVSTKEAKSQHFELLFVICMLLLSGCSAWKEDFEQKPVRGIPKASIHEISTMIDKGEIKEEDVGSVTTIGLNSNRAEGTFFTDGKVSRGYEKVQRIYVAPYEDENKNLHEAHNLYVVVQPAFWKFHKGGKR